MDSILLEQLFQAKKIESELFSLVNLRTHSAQMDGIEELKQQWGAALQDVKDKEAALGL